MSDIINFFSTPNLPEGIPNVIIAQQTDDTLTLPCKHFIPTVSVDVLPPSMRFHADLQICCLGGGLFAVAPECYSYYTDKLSPLGAQIICGSSPLARNYPSDTAYNVARVGNSAFLNMSFTDLTIKKCLGEQKIRLIHVKQGYTKCQIAITGETSFITSDKGIYDTAVKNGFDVLLIQEGGIRLDGYEYGFFGGCAGLCAPDKFFVTGSLKKHPSRHKIYDFLEKQHIELFEGKNDVPVDIGSLIIA